MWGCGNTVPTNGSKNRMVPTEWSTGNASTRSAPCGNLPDIIGKEFQLKNFDALKFPTPHDLY